MASVRTNVLLNGINTVTGIIFPVITFPYAARVLLPEGIGAVNFLNSIVDYIVLLTSLGIPMYAIREIAKYRDDQLNRDKTAIEILLLSCLLCLIGYLIVWLLAEYVPRIHEQSALFYILSLAILFNSIGVNWFYQGIEDFKFITIRAIVIRSLSAIALFLFVKDASDLKFYGVILVASTVGNNFVNFIHLRKHLNLRSIVLMDLDIFRHLLPSVQVFAISLIISIYIRLNSIMLGFMTDDIQVGIYTAGIKIPTICKTLIASVGTVMIPRCSNMFHNGDIEGYAHLLRKSLNLTLCLSLPMLVGGVILAKPLILLFCGGEYVESAFVYRLDAPVIVLGCLSNLVAIQTLFTQGKNKIVVICVIIGAVVNIISNILMIPRYGAMGAAVSSTLAELGVFGMSIFLGRRYIPFGIKAIFNLRYILMSFVMGGVVFMVSMSSLPDYLIVMLGIVSGVIVYGAGLYLVKDSMIIEILNLANRNNKNGNK